MKPLFTALQGTCKTCRFFDDKQPDSPAPMCRRYPPQVSIVMVPQQNAIQRQVSMAPQAVATFPNVNAECWCGEWTGKITATNS